MANGMAMAAQRPAAGRICGAAAVVAAVATPRHRLGRAAAEAEVIASRQRLREAGQ